MRLEMRCRIWAIREKWMVMRKGEEIGIWIVNKGFGQEVIAW
jgi:hypothetical protein